MPAQSSNILPSVVDSPLRPVDRPLIVVQGTTHGSKRPEYGKTVFLSQSSVLLPEPRKYCTPMLPASNPSLQMVEGASASV